MTDTPYNRKIQNFLEEYAIHHKPKREQFK